MQTADPSADGRRSAAGRTAICEGGGISSRRPRAITRFYLLNAFVSHWHTENVLACFWPLSISFNFPAFTNVLETFWIFLLRAWRRWSGAAVCGARNATVRGATSSCCCCSSACASSTPSESTSASRSSPSSTNDIRSSRSRSPANRPTTRPSSSPGTPPYVCLTAVTAAHIQLRIHDTTVRAIGCIAGCTVQPVVQPVVSCRRYIRVHTHYRCWR